MSEGKLAEVVLREEARPAIWLRMPLLLYAILLFLCGLALFLFGSIAYSLTQVVTPEVMPSRWLERLLVASGGLIWLGIGLGGLDLLVLLRFKRSRREVIVDLPAVKDLTVVLTAYNDEE